MFELIKKFPVIFIWIGLIVLVFSLMVTIKIQRSQIEQREYIINTQNQLIEQSNAAVDRLRRLSEEKQRKVDALEKESNKRRKQSQEQLKKLLKEKVPSSCEEARLWAIKKSREF